MLSAAGVAILSVAGDRRLRAAGFAAFAVGGLLLAADLLHGPLARLWHDAGARPLPAAATALVGLAALAVGALVVLRWPTAVMVALVVAAPARIPIHAGGEDANLLVPLYVVIIAIAAAHAVELGRGSERPPRLGAIGPAVAVLVGWTAISMFWTADFHQARVELLFFYLPFSYLMTRVAALRPTERQLRLMLSSQVLLAVVFAAVALWQYQTKHLFWNHTIMVDNQYASFYRVNSLFYDASVYGRFMAVTIVLLLAVAVYRRATPGLLALMAVLFVAQWVSYSQSSVLALAAGAAVIGATVWPRRLAISVAVAMIMVGLVGLVAFAHGKSATDVTSGRSRLVSDGWKVIKQHPVDGAGVGGFARAAAADTAHPGRTKRSASHTTPVTVLAELGPLGLAAYLALLASIAWAAFRSGPHRYTRYALAAALAAVLASSVFYNDYFEDPATWILTGLIAAVMPLPPLQFRRTDD